MATKSQIAYTQYIKVALERIRELKEKGHDVSEANRLLQSIVAAVMDNDINCTDFLINELETVFKRIESLTPPAAFSSTAIDEKPGSGTSGGFPVVFSNQETEPIRYVVKDFTVPVVHEEPRSKLIVAFIYVFLFLFAVTILTLIVYLVRWGA